MGLPPPPLSWYLISRFNGRLCPALSFRSIPLPFFVSMISKQKVGRTSMRSCVYDNIIIYHALRAKDCFVDLSVLSHRFWKEELLVCIIIKWPHYNWQFYLEPYLRPTTIVSARSLPLACPHASWRSFCNWCTPTTGLQLVGLPPPLLLWYLISRFNSHLCPALPSNLCPLPPILCLDDIKAKQQEGLVWEVVCVTPS